MAKQTRDGEIPHSKVLTLTTLTIWICCEKTKKSIVGYFISARVLKKVSAKNNNDNFDNKNVFVIPIFKLKHFRLIHKMEIVPLIELF